MYITCITHADQLIQICSYQHLQSSNLQVHHRTDCIVITSVYIAKDCRLEA